ncbi:hypothetical protein [Streptomyces antimycoticus]|uniref:hypothetical protein n=1 Tax=Streptomyces antimycoticus TaxID=68175 RepID=UPI00367BE2F6
MMIEFDSIAAAVAYLRKRGMSDRMITKRLGVQPPPRRPVSGDRKQVCKRALSVSDIQEMARKYKRPNMSFEKLATEYGVDPKTARKALFEHGVRLRHPDSLDLPIPVHVQGTYRSLTDVIVALHRAGQSTIQIARTTGRSDTYIYDRLVDAGIPIGHSRATLDIDVEKSVEVYRSVRSFRVAAEMLHVSPGTVRRRVRRGGAGIFPVGSWKVGDPDTAPVRVPLPRMSWEVLDRQIIKRINQNWNTARVADDLGITLVEVYEAMRFWRSRNGNEAEILRRRVHGETHTRIAAAMGIRIDRVISALASRNSEVIRLSPSSEPRQ